MTDMTDDQVRALLDGATENAYDLAVVKWGGGIRCVYLNDYRVAGEKPWGGGDTTRRFKVRMADIMQAFRGTVQAAAPDLARALIASEAARKLAEERLAKALVAREKIKAAYEELLATVHGECPSLINEDSGGSQVLLDLILAADEAITTIKELNE